MKIINQDDKTINFKYNNVIYSQLNSIESILPYYNDEINNLTNDKITKVCQNAFIRCSNINTVSLNNCIEIGSHAFGYCNNLIDVYLPNCVTIGMNIFQNCTSLQNCYFPNIINVGAKNFAAGLPPASYTFGFKMSSITENIFNNPTSSAATFNVHFYGLSTENYEFVPSKLILKGTQKMAYTYNIYTDSLSMKNDFVSAASSYTTINVKHYDGSDWEE